MEEFTYSTLTIYRFRGFIPKYVAISAMGISKFWFPSSKKSKVSKLLGTGSGLGFSRKPNFGQYAHFGIWQNKGDELVYLDQNILLRWMKKYAFETFTHRLVPFQSRGIWDGKNPYPTIPPQAESSDKVVILTRAKVKFKHLLDFWKHVSPSNLRLAASEGRIFSAGLGEWPFSHPITYSVWENLDAAKAFAYGHPEHAAAIKGARDGKWFKEDLFVRFELLD
ncbi:MAG: hypothetical protein KJ941_04870 [Bacteroidetes bacterium]|nr:hypothetical protein [Bacteroidota bacterium]